MGRMCWTKELFGVAIALLLSLPVTAQTYQYEVGVAAGVSSYLGDANALQLYSQPQLAGGAIYRYNLNHRWNFKSQLTAAGLAYDTHRTDNYLPEATQGSGTSTLIDLGVQAEFNLFNYGGGRSYEGLKRWSPYMTLGVGVLCALQPSHTVWSGYIPLGVGVKYNLSPRWNIGAEFTLRKSFTDQLDSPLLDDPYGIPSSTGKNSDWYNFALISVTYNFGEIKVKCNNL